MTGCRHWFKAIMFWHRFENIHLRPIGFQPAVGTVQRSKLLSVVAGRHGLFSDLASQVRLGCQRATAVALASRMPRCFLLQPGGQAPMHSEFLGHLHDAVVQRCVGSQLECRAFVLSPTWYQRASGAGRLRQSAHRRDCLPARWRVPRDASTKAVALQVFCSRSLVLAQFGQAFWRINT